MSDLISRKALIDFIEERSGNFGITVANKCNFKEIAKMVKAVDAVEVVRCKDCKYSTPDIMSEDYRACWERNTVMPNDGFCSYGKRKEVTHEET